jgi:hypothetical protein
VCGDERAQGLVGEGGDGAELVAQSAGQGHDANVAEAQGSGSLALTVVGQVDALVERVQPMAQLWPARSMISSRWLTWRIDSCHR